MTNRIIPIIICVSCLEHWPTSVTAGYRKMPGAGMSGGGGGRPTSFTAPLSPHFTLPSPYNQDVTRDPKEDESPPS
jgi:hypothetical protein